MSNETTAEQLATERAAKLHREGVAAYDPDEPATTRALVAPDGTVYVVRADGSWYRECWDGSWVGDNSNASTTPEQVRKVYGL